MARNTTSAVGERQILPRQTKRILTALLFYAVAPPAQAGTEGATVVGCLVLERRRLLPVLHIHLIGVLLRARSIAGAADHGAGETAEDGSRTPVPARRARGAENRAGNGSDGGTGPRRGTTRDHTVLRGNVGRAGVEAGLVNRPQAALVAVLALLVGRLALLRISVDGRVRRRADIGRRRRGRRPGRRRVHAAREAQSERRQRGDPGDAPDSLRILQQFDTHGL